MLGAMVRGSEGRRKRGEVRVRGGGAVAAMDQKEALETTVVKAVKRAGLLQRLLLLLCLIAIFVVVVVVVVLEKIAPCASCTKCREATIALKRMRAIGPGKSMKTDEENRGS